MEDSYQIINPDFFSGFNRPTFENFIIAETTSKKEAITLFQKYYPIMKPCWLNPEQLEQAEALIQQGFCFCGDENNFCLDGDFALKVAGWRFYWAIGYIALDATCNGALYSLDLEIQGIDNDGTLRRQALSNAKQAIKEIQIKNKKCQPIQLSLFSGGTTNEH